MRRVARIAPAALWAASIWFLSSMPDPPGAGALSIPHADKIAHAGLFFVLAVLLRVAGARRWAAFAAATAWGVVDEAHQAFVPGRDADLADLAADAVGAAAGAWIVTSFARRRGSTG